MQTETAPPEAAAKKERVDAYEAVTQTILKHLESGVVPWRCPWNREVGRPRNYHTGKTYRGVNLLLLGLGRFSSPFWLTFTQVKALGGSVRKGERGTSSDAYLRGLHPDNPQLPNETGGLNRKEVWINLRQRDSSS